MLVGSAAINVAFFMLAMGGVTARLRSPEPVAIHDVPTGFADGLEEVEPEHADAPDEEHGGRPGKGGKPMVPRTHEEEKAVHKHDWTYQDPESWEKEYFACGGKLQSPVNIVSSKAVHGGKERLALSYSPLEGRHLDNNGHNVQVNGEFGNLTLPDGVYEVKQFHFHFPSEHSVDGELATAEMHIVHQKVGSVGTDDLAVVGVLFQVNKTMTDTASRPEIAFMRQVGFSGAGLPKAKTALLIKDAVDLHASFAKELNGPFWHYEGSLTTPPCSETVKWFVLENRAPVTVGMLAHFKAMFPDPANNRPVQALHTRKVVESEVKDPNDVKSGASQSSAWVVALALCVVAQYVH